jgi:hypothetical protein
MLSEGLLEEGGRLTLALPGTESEERMRRALGPRTAVAIVPLLLALSPLTFLALAPPALATYPGTNGKLGFVGPNSGDPSDIFSVNLDGTGLMDLTRNGAHNTVLRWSPDGTKVAFVSDGDGEDNNYDV